MNPRHLILLSPYRLPTETTLYLGDEEVSAFLNGYSVLWHPAALAGAAELPRIASPYDHEQPTAGHVYAVPDNPPLMLPDDWEQNARAAGAVVFKATPNRDETLRNLLDSLAATLGENDPGRPLLQLPAEQVRPFSGLALGTLVLEALFEAMSHENVLSAPELWQDVSAAVAALGGIASGDADHRQDASRLHLQSAAERQLAAREVVYPVTVYVIDLMLVDEHKLDVQWPACLAAGQPINIIACASLLARLQREQPERFSELREKVGADLAEVLGGPWMEREDPFLPLESQAWNLLHGQAVYQELLGQEVRVFARKGFGFHHQLPLLLQAVGIGHALLVAFDEAVIPTHRSPVVNWPSHDGKQVDCFTRVPQPADTPQTFFHLAHYLHQTIMQDSAATLALLHRDRPASPFYEDWLELSRLAPVLGRWTTLSGYFNEVLTGDYTSPASPDEFHGDYLTERTAVTHAEGQETSPEAPPPNISRPTPFPISWFATQLRGRRRIDAAWTFTAMLRSLGGQVEPVDGQPFVQFLTALEDRFESQEVSAQEVHAAQERSAAALAKRLIARGPLNSPGYLILNPCSFIRRIALELPGISTPLPTGGHLKACQIEGDTARVVVEVPALGFAWVPKKAAAAPPAAAAKMRLADDRFVRNEFFEAEIDQQTGGLRAVRDQRTRISRLGAMLVFNPGSSMRATRIEVTSSGPALGEIISEGNLLDEQQQVLATFRQRFRIWLARPLLEIKIELNPVKPPEGYPWHAYYAARFAWRDENAALLRGCFGSAVLTAQTRPETPDFIEVETRSATSANRRNAVIFPGGLPFHQRNGGRMLDVLLITEGETATTFELGISLDREQPMQTALGIASPVGVVDCEQGPPHVGATGWLFHLDAANVLLSSLRPAPDGGDGVVATLLESNGQGGQVGFRCVRNPVWGRLQDLRGNAVLDVGTADDTVLLEVSPNDLLQVRAEFS